MLVRIKKMISIAIAAAIVMGTVPVFAGGNHADSADFATGINTLYQNTKVQEDKDSKFLQLITTLKAADDVSAVSGVYSSVITALGVSGTSYGADVAAVGELSTFVNNMTDRDFDTFVKLVQAGDVTKLTGAFESNGFNDKLIVADITKDELNKSLQKMQGMLELVVLTEAFSTNVLKLNTSTKQMTVDTDKLNAVYSLPVVEKFTSISKENAVAGLSTLATQIAGMTNKADQQLLINYLKANGMIVEFTPTTTPPTTTPPTTTPPTTTPTVQNPTTDSAKKMNDLKNKVKDVASAKEAAKEAVKELNAASKNLSKLSPTQVEAVAVDMIKSTAALIAQMDKVSKKDAAEVKAQLMEFIERAVAQVTRTSIKTTDDGKATIPADQAKANIQKAQALKTKLEKELKDNGITVTKNVPIILTFDMEAKKDTAAVTFPKELLKELTANVKVRVNTGLVSFMIDKDTFANEEATLEVKKVIVAGYKNVLEFNTNSSFKKPIQVVIPMELATTENAEFASIYFLNETTNQPVAMGGVYNEVDGGVEGVLAHFSKYFAKVAEPKIFADAKAIAWANNEISVLASKGYIKGKSASEFKPMDEITRAEFAALVVRMLKLENSAVDTTFTDVKSSDWFAKDVAAAYGAGFIMGRSATTFDPTASITRQEMANIIAKALTQKGYVTGVQADLADVKDKDTIASWAKDAVAAAYREGILTGKPGNMFAPTANANRAEAAVILYRLLDK